MEKQRERKDIDVKDTWDLTLIFKTPEEFLQSLKEIQNEIKNIEKFKGHILDNENTLYEFLTYSDELERKIYKLYYYAHLNFDSENEINRIKDDINGANQTLVELQKEVETLANAKYLNERIDLKLESQEQVKTALEKMNSFEKIAEFKVIKKDAKDGIKIYLDDEQSWILVRASGTEPLLRIYFETDKVEKMTLLQKDVLNLIK